MRLLLASIVCLLTCSLVTSLQLPCDSPLRRFPSLSHFFTHCECSRSEWTEWAAIGTTNASACPSGRAVIEERRQTVLTGNCNETIESKATCEPTNEEKLILALGLGSRGHSISTGCRGRRSMKSLGDHIPLPDHYYPDPNDPFPDPPTFVPNPINPPGNSTCQNCLIRLTDPCRMKRSTCKRRHRICSHIGRKRRSLKTEMKPSHIHINSHSSNAELESEPDNPIPFDVLKHGHRYRRDNHRECSESQHILFVLDTSGSIGLPNFRKMTTALSCLVPLFCNPIKIAVITFNHQYFMEFCFDCFGGTCEGRKAASDAITAIPYRSGLTHTGGVVQCLNELLTNRQMCNFSIDDEYTHCLDVVFITDGKSNGPLDVCHEISNSRLHNDSKIEVHAIGIGNSVNMNEINCLRGNNTDLIIDLNYPSFEEFITTLNSIVWLLKNDTFNHNVNGSRFTCTNAYLDLAPQNNSLCMTDVCKAIQ